MILLILFGTFLATGLIMAAGRIKLDIVWKNLDRTITLQYLFFRRTFPIKKGNDKPFTEQPKEEEKEEKTVRRKSGGFSTANIKVAPDFLPAVRKFFELFTRYGRITRLNFSGELGTGNPYYTGLSYGMAQTFGQSIKSVFPLFEVCLIPNFEEEVYEFSARGSGEIRLFSLLLTLFVTVIYLPKRQIWQLARSR